MQKRTSLIFGIPLTYHAPTLCAKFENKPALDFRMLFHVETSVREHDDDVDDEDEDDAADLCGDDNSDDKVDDDPIASNDVHR